MGESEESNSQAKAEGEAVVDISGTVDDSGGEAGNEVAELPKSDSLSNVNSKDGVLRKKSTYLNEPPWTKARSGRQLSFADDHGAQLKETCFTDRLHYHDKRKNCCVVC